MGAVDGVSDNGGLGNVVGLDSQLVVNNGVGLGVGGHDRGGGVGSNGLSVDMGLVDDLLDGMDLVGLGNVDGTGNVIGDGVGDVLVDNDLTLDGDGDMDGHINVVLVDLGDGDNVGLLGSDPGVGPDGGKGLGDGHGVSGGGTGGNRGGGDGSIGSGGSGQDWSGQGLDADVVLGGGGLVGGGGLGNDLVVALDVLVAGLDLLEAGVHGLGADNTVLGVGGDLSGSGGVAVVGLVGGHGTGHGLAEVGSADGTGVAEVANAGGAGDAGNKGEGDLYRKRDINYLAIK